jgi:hypothetical protein
MQEFSSISVSSYEAGTLADRLTEQAHDGWSVVAIVPTGSTITAYLSRATDGHSDAASPASVVASVPMPDTHDEPSGDEPGADEPDAHEAAADAPMIPEPATADSDDAGASGHFDATTDEPADPVSEAPGWAAGAGGAASTYDSGISSPSDIDAGAPVPSTSTESAIGDATADTATTSDASAAGAAPAGWYADPSARFELRYWDGTQWTEHVSRSGQQYTDPPVA